MADPEYTDKQLVTFAMQVVKKQFVGTLTTVDRDGQPHSRWMGASPIAEGLSKLYTLTGKRTRKLKHIERNPRVCWQFTAPNYEEVVKLTGEATVLSAPVVSQQVWDRLAQAARTYVMNVLSNQDNLEFVTIETQIDTVEYLCASKGLVAPHVIRLADVVATGA